LGFGIAVQRTFKWNASISSQTLTITDSKLKIGDIAIAQVNGGKYRATYLSSGEIRQAYGDIKNLAVQLNPGMIEKWTTSAHFTNAKPRVQAKLGKKHEQDR